jgi:transcription initiation factor TFIIIB Brf1 subunit/transcription initiation factor TFIIB
MTHETILDNMREKIAAAQRLTDSVRKELGIDDSDGGPLRSQFIPHFAKALDCSEDTAKKAVSMISEWKFERVYLKIKNGELILNNGKLTRS